MGRKSNKEIIKEQKVTIKELFTTYTFLLCAAVIFIYSLHNLTISYQGVELNVMFLCAPFLIFIANVITKEIGYKCGFMSICISSIILFIYALCSNYFILGDFKIFEVLGFTCSYFISQQVSLSIYYYLLVNTRLPIIGVIVNYIFALLINNMICMLFVYNMILTDTFWLEYILLVLFQGVLAIILSLCDKIVERGID